MSHLYSCRERVSAAAAPYTSRSLSLGACVPVRARAPTRSQRATASKQCPALSLYCCLLAAERIFQSKRGKTSKDPETAAWILGLQKQASKWRSAVYAGAGFHYLQAQVCHLAFVPRISALLSTHFCFISAET